MRDLTTAARGAPRRKRLPGRMRWVSRESPSRGSRRKVVPDGGGEEPESEVPSIPNKRAAAESQPLVSFLQVIRSDKHGSVFERRLEGLGWISEPHTAPRGPRDGAGQAGSPGIGLLVCDS